MKEETISESPSTSLDPRDLPPALFFRRTASLSLCDANARRWLAHTLRGELRPEELPSGILPKRIVRRLLPLPQLELVDIRTSQVDHFQKLLFRSPLGGVLETVIIPLHRPGAVSLCLSSQIGCVMQCAFCATGRMVERRNLHQWEIIDQYVQARNIVESQKRRVTGAVFMGMGEPFLNYDRVLGAAELLHYPVVGAIRGEAITVSTVGLVPEIDRFTAENRPFRLSVSIGAATDEKRSHLVPIAARTPVKNVMAAAARYGAARKTRVNIAYVCISGANVGVEDAEALAELIGDTPVRLDLIDVTDFTGQFQPPTEGELKAFRDALSNLLRQPVVRRYSGGKDIQAACGTLAGQQ